MTNQVQQVLTYLRKNPRGGITSWQAVQMFGCTRLARVIHTLRGRHTIPSEMRNLGNGKRIAIYRLSP